MSSRWQIIDLVDFSGEIVTKRGRLVINETEVPLTEVLCVLVGERTAWNGTFVHLTAKYEVPILTCDWRGVPIAVNYFWSSNSRVAARHMAQTALSIPRQKNAWAQIVKAKIRGQAQNLAGNLEVQNRLMNLANSVRSGDLDNKEAQAARTYWNSLWIEEGFVRDVNLAGRNALLNYGYAVLRGTVVRGIVTAGLIPALGIWHRNRSNAFALADDLIEPFRPAVDAIVLTLDQKADLGDTEVKRRLVSVLELPMSRDGYTVGSKIQDLCQKFARYVEGEYEVLEVPIWKGRVG